MYDRQMTRSFVAVSITRMGHSDRGGQGTNQQHVDS